MSRARKHPPQPSTEVLLVEYEQAQSSAQHHDGLVWATSNVFVAISAALLAFAGSAVIQLPTTAPRYPMALALLLLLVTVVGVGLLRFARKCQQDFLNIKRQKYARCKEIERALGMCQHLQTSHPGGSQTTGYLVLLLGIGLIWVSVLAYGLWLTIPRAVSAAQACTVTQPLIEAPVS